MANYVGFSAEQFENGNTFKLTDIDLIKEDLTLHILTQRNTRIHLPEFGTNIPKLTGDILDDITIDDIREELIDVFDYDPRVKLDNLAIIPEYNTQTLQITATLIFVELDITDSFDINLEFKN